MLQFFLGVGVLLLGVQHSKNELRFTDPILFDFYRGHKLDVTEAAKSQSTKAKNMMKCLSNCVPIDWCKSVNLKNKPGEDGLRLCELLSSDRFTKVNNLRKDVAYDHLNIKTPCDAKGKPCYNGGEGILKDGNYTCKCHGKHVGELCNKDGLWTPWGHCACPCPQTRSRTCQNPVTNSSASDCPGSSKDTRQCETVPAFTISGCDSPLGMSDGRIPDQSISAFSKLTNRADCLPKFARLNRGGSWCSNTGTLGKEYLQIDLGSVTNITNVATQGRPVSARWVTEYSLSYSNDAASWTQYNGTNLQCVKIFYGNADKNTVVTNGLPVPIRARYVKIIPLAIYSDLSCMRLELYGC